MLEDTSPAHPSDPEAVADDELLFDDADSPTEPPLEGYAGLAESQVHEGEVLMGKYRVEREPGRRGLDVLVDVRHLELAETLTLKYLAPDACIHPEYVRRFMREARDASQITGERVARVMDVGRLDFGAPYLVRESLRGPDLAEISRVRGPLPIAEAVDYILQASEGVAEGHAVGIPHRNLRPTTLVAAAMSDGTSVVKVFDFAATEPIHVDPLTHRATALVGTSAVMSSLPYMAPEQIREPDDVDVRADVYALGAMLHELLTGTAVFRGENAAALVATIAADAPASLHQFRPDVPNELERVVLCCLEKSREARYSSLASLVMALRPFASEASDLSIERVLRLARAVPSRLPARASQPSSSSADVVESPELAAVVLPMSGAATTPEPASVSPTWNQSRAQARHPEQNEPSVVPPIARSWPPGPGREPSSRWSSWALVAAAASLVAFCAAQQLGSPRRSAASRALSAPATPSAAAPQPAAPQPTAAAPEIRAAASPPAAPATSAAPVVAPAKTSALLLGSSAHPSAPPPKKKAPTSARLKSGKDLFSTPD